LAARTFVGENLEDPGPYVPNFRRLKVELNAAAWLTDSSREILT